MAYSPAPTSPGPSGVAPMMSNGLHSRGRSVSPPTGVPLSKRDKRRSALQERLHDLTASFSQNRDTQFRQQLHALQCDMTLINNADPYNPGPIPDSAEEIAQLIESTVGGGQFAREMASLAGMWYARFVQEVNQVKAERDADLAMLVHRHNNNLERFQREYAFRAHFAEEEYNNLSATLRERLVQTLSGKRARLMREKEQLDIVDTNALLLHPNQFSITNPASPGGIHGNRKTRHTRHRVDLDELGNGIMTEHLNKRKRKAPEEDVGSPVRETPAERAKAQVAQQQLAPTYSIQSLFTEKELSAHANQAHIATVHFFSTSKRADQPSGAVTNGNNTDAEEASGVDGTGAEDNGTPATDMARTASQNFHATRSTRTHGNHALNPLAELSDKPAVRPNLPYNILANYHARPSNSGAPPLPPLMNEEVDDDWNRMDKMASKPPGHVDRNLIQLLVEQTPAEINGIPQNPNRFSLLHPDFPTEVGMHLYPLRKDGESNERAKKPRTG
ncbi:protein sds3 [Aspergillus nidulans FGSC A4]|uniref:Deacetylase complex subunit Sds3, putative (AFU_orthologue AFUA_3G13150) n=1 Tax=Emericella nidulans (strain FGSC A4 / ATCC 38163 / CBS 112.46 / NRRL 194 / M139) TaxID=227321 RepID=C8VID5_EMENI|nr:protein sds3 [Aspergillus nidulans FGSC A4]CBF83251.1 TPA: deacetylase complex subunit Sds3, putative (AFU_orthologue; AFUA_3G13150) [Aspergillus nidulans FGSC A4]